MPHPLSAAPPGRFLVLLSRVKQRQQQQEQQEQQQHEQQHVAEITLENVYQDSLHSNMKSEEWVEREGRGIKSEEESRKMFNVLCHKQFN